MDTIKYILAGLIASSVAILVLLIVSGITLIIPIYVIKSIISDGFNIINTFLGLTYIFTIFYFIGKSILE